MKNFKKILITLTLIMICAFTLFAFTACDEEDSGSEGGANTAGYANVLDYGAVADNPRVDSYPAFLKACNEERSIYVPKGTYYCSGTIELFDQILFGDGMVKSTIIFTNPDIKAVGIKACHFSSIRDIQLQFDRSLITNKEAEGDRVLLLTGNGESMLQRGSDVRNVRFNYCGTAIYSPNMPGYESFSVTYDTLEIFNFSFRGVDFQAANRTGNVFNNIYIMSDTYEVDSLFNMNGEESETTISQLNLEHSKVKRAALSLCGVRALNISSLHIEGVVLVNDEADFIWVSETSGTIGSLSIFYTSIDANNCSFLEVYSNKYYNDANFQTLNELRIMTLHLKGMNDPNADVHSPKTEGLAECPTFTFFKRTAGQTGDFFVDIYNVAYYTFRGDVSYYQNLSKTGNITVTLH